MQGATLSLIRPPEPAISAPTGQDAKPIQWAAWVDHPGISATAAAVRAVFQEAEQGWPTAQCDLFDDFIEADGHLRNALEQREQEVAGKPWAVQASGADADDQLAARLIDFALRRLPLVEAIKHLLLFNRYGYSAIEIDWDLVEFEGRLYTLPVHLALVPARRFRIDTVTDELKLIVDLTSDPLPLRKDKWIIARRSPTQVARSGLMRTASWPALWKRLGTRNWVIDSQRHGVPLPHVQYAGNADEATKAAAREVVRKFGTNGGAATSEDLKITIHEAGQLSADMQDRLISHCDGENSKLVLGSTLTNDSSDGGPGSYAMADVHVGTKWGNVLYDAEVVQDTIGFGLIEPICRFNGLRSRCPLQIQVVRDLDTETMLDAFDHAIENDIPVAVSQFRQVTGWRQPATPADRVPGKRAAGATGTGPKPAPPTATDDPKPDDPKPEPAPTAGDASAPTEPKKAKAAADSEAKLFEYHLPVVTVNEVRERWLHLEPVEGGDMYVSEWIAKFSPADKPEPEAP